MTGRNDAIDAIMQVIEAAFDPAYGEAWNRKQISDALVMPNTYFLLVNERGAMIHDYSDETAGFVMTRSAADEEELLLIGVKPEWRRRGIGESLMKLLCEQAKTRGIGRIFLEMRKGNPAKHLYHKVGFEPIGRRREYYRLANGERVDAITYRLSI